MPNHSKGLTERVTLRHTAQEDTMITNVVQAFTEYGIKISRNDAVRVSIRIGAVPLPGAPDDSKKRLLAHVEDFCQHCTGERLACPEGQWLWDHHKAVLATQRATRTATPPPTEITRRTVSGRRPLLPPAPGTKAG